MSETLLLSRQHIKAMYDKLEKWPEAASICPACNNVFTDRYEACNCKEFRP